MFTLTNKTALVTGASRGIGRATARALARADARVVVHYGRAAAEAEFADAQPRGQNSYKVALGKVTMVRALLDAQAMEIS